MKIEAVDAFYLRMPDVRDIGDGSQDALLIRVAAGGFVGWGECEASPLTTIAALVAPMSHSACHPVLDDVLGAWLDGPDSIRTIHQRVKARSMDLLQADHALSGIDIALWDLLGKKEREPVWSLLSGQSFYFPREAYASQLFGDTPDETFTAARAVTGSNFSAAKFGWGPIGQGSVAEDREQFAAAREGLGEERTLFVDTGCVFGHDVRRAVERIPLFEEFAIGWWEEPFVAGAIEEYSQLAAKTRVSLAGGEGSHSADQGKQIVRYGGVRYVQIDAGRVGGITAAREVAEYARSRDVMFVNHTFTSNLALSASLQACPRDAIPYAEVPFAASELAKAIGGDIWMPDTNGNIQLPFAPGLGVEVDPAAIREYVEDVEISVAGKVLWRSPSL